MKEVFIVAVGRTPVGGFLGTLSDCSATELGGIAIRGVMEKIGVGTEEVDSVYFGNGVSANLGQSPARQAAIKAGISDRTDATTINKVCSSGMKAIVMGAQQIQLGREHIVVVGGMESMSNAPFYTAMRKGHKFGNATAVDGLLKDGLTDAYHGFHMGNAAEITVRDFSLSREVQDEYALLSYQRAVEATQSGKFKNEIIPVTLTSRAGERVIEEDEDIYKLKVEKVSRLKPAFEENGTITPANASNLNDGAAALVLASAEAVRKNGWKPLARILDYADGAQAPELFSTSPSIAIEKVLVTNELKAGEIDFWEVNEAYASVVLANQKLTGYSTDRVNVYGGAVSIGHPIGASGARITTTLLSVLSQEGGKLGLAAICNGGGGATALLVERYEA